MNRKKRNTRIISIMLVAQFIFLYISPLSPTPSPELPPVVLAMVEVERYTPAVASAATVSVFAGFPSPPPVSRPVGE
jgi:hypothetical protein